MALSAGAAASLPAVAGAFLSSSRLTGMTTDDGVLLVVLDLEDSDEVDDVDD